jgi:intracellular multiplication protein IcmS
MKLELSSQLGALATRLKVRFTYGGKMLSHEEVFSAVGLLPAMAKRADQLCSLCLGYGIGVTFEDAEKSILGTEVKFDEATPTVLRLMCLTDVIHELIKASGNQELVSLDELMYD